MIERLLYFRFSYGEGTVRRGFSLENLLHRIASIWERGDGHGRQEHKASARSKLSTRDSAVFQLYMGQFFIYHTFVKTVVGVLTELVHACNAKEVPKLPLPYSIVCFLPRVIRRKEGIWSSRKNWFYLIFINQN